MRRTSPVSTLPGPVSTNLRTPARTARSAPRATARASSAPRGRARTSSNGRAAVLEMTGTRGGPTSTSASAPRTPAPPPPSPGSGTLPGRAAGSSCRPACLSSGLAAARASAGTRQDELPGSVLVRERQPEPLGDVARRRLVAERGEHAAWGTALGGVLHHPAARDRQRQPVVLAEAAGGDQRGELAERVPGHVRGRGAAGVRPSGEAGAVQRRLSERGAFVDAFERVDSELVDRLIEQRGRTRSTSSRMSSLWLPWPGKSSAVSWSSRTTA